MTDSPCLLIVEDDEPTRTFLADNLTADGYELLVAGGVRDALRELEFHRVDLAVIDVGLPDGSGLDVVAAVRATRDAGARLDARLPIVLLSGRAAEIDRVRGFERGADDFVAKPFAYGELRLRVAALLRRTTERRGSGRLRIGGLAIDPASREVRLRGAPVSLSQKEFALLRALAVEPTRVFTKAELLRDVWGFRAIGATRTLDSHASRKVRESSIDQASPLGAHGGRPARPGSRPALDVFRPWLRSAKRARPRSQRPQVGTAGASAAGKVAILLEPGDAFGASAPMRCQPTVPPGRHRPATAS